MKKSHKCKKKKKKSSTSTVPLCPKKSPWHLQTFKDIYNQRPLSPAPMWYVCQCIYLYSSLCVCVCVFWPVYRISPVDFHRWSQEGQLWSASPPSCWQVEADKRRTPSLAQPPRHAGTDTGQTDLLSDSGSALAGGWRGRGGEGTWWAERRTDNRYVRKSNLHWFISLPPQTGWLSWWK